MEDAFEEESLGPPDAQLVEADPVDGDRFRVGIDRIVGIRRETSRLQAVEHRELARLSRLARESIPADCPNRGQELEWRQRSLVAELAVAARVSDRTMAARLAEAETLVDQFPATLAALQAGAINNGHVRVIIQHGLPIGDDAARAAYEEAVLEPAGRLTPGRLRRTAQLAAARLAEGSFEDRHRTAAAERSVQMSELADGMSQIIHTMPTVLATGIMDRLTQAAKAMHHAGDLRSFDQLRADLAVELLLTGEPATGPDAPHGAAAGIRAEVSIIIPALTLLGRSDEPASLAGAGPIGLADAKVLAANAPSLIRILTHPTSGMVLAVDTYRPSEQLRRFLHFRDSHCRFPTCGQAAERCDIDHTVPAQAGGPTSADNLACLCRRHHVLKHHGGWSVKQTSPGILEWTSPHGIVAIDQPEDPVHFTD